jgi:cytidylate kinase
MMVREQRKLGAHGGVVVEGRDIGTVVFPAADLKIFMVADVRQRAMRRQKELRQQEVEVSLEELVEEIRERDRKDSERGMSPLLKAGDAIELDTSNLSIGEQVDFIVRQAEKVQQEH